YTVLTPHLARAAASRTVSHGLISVARPSVSSAEPWLFAATELAELIFIALTLSCSRDQSSSLRLPSYPSRRFTGVPKNAAGSGVPRSRHITFRIHRFAKSMMAAPPSDVRRVVPGVLGNPYSISYS